MEKILNLIFLVGTLLRQLAKFLAPTMPAFKDLKEANKRNELLAALKSELESDEKIKNALVLEQQKEIEKLKTQISKSNEGNT